MRKTPVQSHTSRVTNWQLTGLFDGRRTNQRRLHRSPPYILSPLHIDLETYPVTIEATR